MRKFFAGTVVGLVLSLAIVATRSDAQQRLNQGERILTVLNDPKALEALRSSGGLRIVWWKNGDKLVSLGQPRWIIPGMVKPQISGDATGAEYYFFDQVTGVKQGPFKPEAQ